MGCFGSKQKLTKEDLEFLKSHTRYDEATIKEWYKGFRVRSSHFCLCPPVEQLSFSLNSYSPVPSLSFTRRIFCCQSAPPVHPHGQVFLGSSSLCSERREGGEGKTKIISIVIASFVCHSTGDQHGTSRCSRVFDLYTYRRLLFLPASTPPTRL